MKTKSKIGINNDNQNRKPTGDPLRTRHFSAMYFPLIPWKIIHLRLLLQNYYFSHSQTVVVCGNYQTVLCQPTGGKARLTEGCSFIRRGDYEDHGGQFSVYHQFYDIIYHRFNAEL
ncbi:40S ribosomal protein S27-2 [Platanthera guangdongensis]|uniref:40S ribosomal protein S27-2 n=1 Tax=Platanthera guangdongensis TaxID=2320717 RepID=A0ABR2MN99_9ASPA